MPTPLRTLRRLSASEPQLDDIYDHIGEKDDCTVFAVEYLPGQFDQRADSAAQCIQIISKGERPLVKTAKVYMIYGNVSQNGIDALKKYVINPVESREASLKRLETLATSSKGVISPISLPNDT